MTQTSLEEAVRETFADKQLSSAQLAALGALQEVEPSRPSKPARKYLAIAAAAGVLALSAVAWFASQGDGHHTLSADIASEVARNHTNLKPLEVQTDRIAAVRPFFAKLDFVPIDSATLGAHGWRLLGGRYCSLKGHDAAQLRMMDPKTASLQSVYMVAYDEGTFAGLPDVDAGEAPVVVSERGVRVRMWREAGVVVATTLPP